MKKTLTIVLILMFILFTSACSSEENNRTSEGNPSSSVEEKSAKINLNDYVKVSFSGKNLAGYGSVSFDKESFLLDNIDNITFNKKNEQVFREIYGDTDKSPASEALKCISVELDKSNRLSNGDTVEIVWNIDTTKITTYFEFDYTYSSQTFTVSELPEADTFDPFETLQLNYSGVAPYSSVSVIDYANYYPGEYIISPNSNLKNGDIIKVSFNCDDESTMIANYGKYPSCYEKEYTVSGLHSYVQSLEEISTEQYDELVNNALSKIWVLGYGQYDDALYLGNYFYIAKDKQAHGVHFLQWCGLPVGNAICLVFEHPKEIGTHLESEKAYTVIALENLLIDENGDLVYKKQEMWEYNKYNSKEDVQNAFVSVHDEIMQCIDNVTFN